jgi:hypothetical protein
MKRTPLKSYKSLRRTPLKSSGKPMKQSPLKICSDKQAILNKLWAKIKKQRIELLIEKYGYLPDEYTGEDITNAYIIDGHHNNHNRKDNFLWNCRILKRLSHITVTDNNVKDVKDWLA